MKTSDNTNPVISICPHSKNRAFIDKNGTLVYLKHYKGDWGDWDEKIPDSKINEFHEQKVHKATVSLELKKTDEC